MARTRHLRSNCFSRFLAISPKSHTEGQLMTVGKHVAAHLDYLSAATQRVSKMRLKSYFCFQRHKHSPLALIFPQYSFPVCVFSSATTAWNVIGLVWNVHKNFMYFLRVCVSQFVCATISDTQGAIWPRAAKEQTHNTEQCYW